MRISFGPFAFDRQSRLLWREGTEIALPPRVLGVLEVLIDRAGQVVARQDLMDGVWKDAFVTDTSLAEAISFLRQALGDDPQSPRYIQTIHRRGYRFLAPVIPDTPPATAPDEKPAVAPTAPAPAPSRAWQFLPLWVAIGCSALGAGAAAWRMARQPEPEPAPIARFEVVPVAGTFFDRREPAIAISADARTIVWSACDARSAACALYVRSVDRFDPQRIAGTEDASQPFVSPDGRWIGFFAEGKLKKISVSGGPASVLADAPAPGGGTWDGSGRIAFAGLPAGGIGVVPDEGGAVTPLTTPRFDRGEVRHRYPSWLSSGGLVFTVSSSPVEDARGDLAVIPANGRDWTTLRAGVTRAAPVTPAYLVLSNGSDLQAATFDERRPALTGGSDSVLASVTGGTPLADFAVGGGALIAVPAATAGAVWADGSDAAALGRLSSIAISPDGRRAAGVIAESAGADVWIADLASSGLTRVTYSGTNVSPAWSADGSRLFFASRTSGPFHVAVWDGTTRRTADIPATGAVDLFPSSAAPDGRLAVTAIAANGHTGVGLVPASGGAIALQSSGPFDEAAPAFSPDGDWLALESTESGRREVIVRHARDGRRFAVSNGGGAHPRWSADGRAIYYDAGMGGDSRVMRAAFDPANTSSAVRAPELFHDAAPGRVLAVTPAGRVLVQRRAPAAGRALVTLQWVRDLRQRLPLPVTAPR